MTDREACRIIRRYNGKFRKTPSGRTPVLQALPDIRAVLFDVYGTLLLSETNWRPDAPPADKTLLRLSRIAARTGPAGGPLALVNRVQAEISAARLATKIGREIEVIVDEEDEVGTLARSHADAPEIDGVVYLEGVFGLQPGTRLKVRVEEADEHDLWATPV